MDQNITAKLKDKKFQKNILIYLIVFVVIIILLNWLIKSGQNSRNKNETESFNDYYKGLQARCSQEDKELYNCCLASVKQMAASNNKLAADLGCDLGFKINTLKCLGAYKWCEIIR